MDTEKLDQLPQPGQAPAYVGVAATFTNGTTTVMVTEVEAPASGRVAATDETAPAGYKSADDGYKKLSEDYDYWTGKLTDTNLQLCYAVIAANWAVFGSANQINQILHNRYSEGSIALVLFALAVNLFGSWLLGWLHGRRANRAERNPQEWNLEFERYKNRKNQIFPITRTIKTVASITRFIKVCFPIAGGVLFLIALLRR